MMKIDKNKEYTTRSGLQVRIYATDGGGKYPIHGAYKANSGWHQESWSELGKAQYDALMGSGADLIEKPKVQSAEAFVLSRCNDFSNDKLIFVRFHFKNRIMHSLPADSFHALLDEYADQKYKHLISSDDE